MRRILGGGGGGHVPMINTFDLDGTGAPRFVNMFNLYENAAIDQIIDRVARTNSASTEPDKRRLNTHRLPLRVTDWPAAFKLARMISQRSRGYRVKRSVAGETTAFSRLTTPRDVETRERERESDVAFPDNRGSFSCDHRELAMG